jgi:hypothetical protein
MVSYLTAVVLAVTGMMEGFWVRKPDLHLLAGGPNLRKVTENDKGLERWSFALALSSIWAIIGLNARH